MSGDGGRLSHDWYCGAITEQADQLGALLARVSGTEPVPTCPGWTLDDLTRHLSDNLAQVEAAVTGRAAPRTREPAAGGSEAGHPTVTGHATVTGQSTGPESGPVDAAQVEVAELVDAASALATALRAAGPDAEAELWGLRQSTAEWARRGAHELLVHRADASFAAGVDFAADTAAATDALEELLTLTGEASALRGTDEVLRLRATDRIGADGAVSGDTVTEWTVLLTPEGARWQRGAGDGGPRAELSGRATELLLVAYRRLPLDDPRVTVTGDRALLDRWRAGTVLG